MQKVVEWKWKEDCDVSFRKLKEIVGQDITLKELKLGDQAGMIWLAVDSSEAGAIAIHSQEEEGMDRPVCYKLVMFTEVEARYLQPKLELCGVTKILQKLQHILWGVYFKLLVDAESLARMINFLTLPNRANDSMGGVSSFVLVSSLACARKGIHNAGCAVKITRGILG